MKLGSVCLLLAVCCSISKCQRLEQIGAINKNSTNSLSNKELKNININDLKRRKVEGKVNLPEKQEQQQTNNAEIFVRDPHRTLFNAQPVTDYISLTPAFPGARIPSLRIPSPIVALKTHIEPQKVYYFPTGTSLGLLPPSLPLNEFRTVSNHDFIGLENNNLKTNPNVEVNTAVEESKSLPQQSSAKINKNTEQKTPENLVLPLGSETESRSRQINSPPFEDSRALPLNSAPALNTPGFEEFKQKSDALFAEVEKVAQEIRSSPRQNPAALPSFKNKLVTNLELKEENQNPAELPTSETEIKATPESSTDSVSQVQQPNPESPPYSLSSGFVEQKSSPPLNITSQDIRAKPAGPVLSSGLNTFVDRLSQVQANPESSPYSLSSGFNQFIEEGKSSTPLNIINQESKSKPAGPVLSSGFNTFVDRISHVQQPNPESLPYHLSSGFSQFLEGQKPFTPFNIAYQNSNSNPAGPALSSGFNTFVDHLSQEQLPKPLPYPLSSGFSQFLEGQKPFTPFNIAYQNSNSKPAGPALSSGFNTFVDHLSQVQQSNPEPLPNPLSSGFSQFVEQKPSTPINIAYQYSNSKPAGPAQSSGINTFVDHLSQVQQSKPESRPYPLSSGFYQFVGQKSSPFNIAYQNSNSKPPISSGFVDRISQTPQTNIGLSSYPLTSGLNTFLEGKPVFYQFKEPESFSPGFNAFVYRNSHQVSQPNLDLPLSSGFRKFVHEQTSTPFYIANQEIKSNPSVPAHSSDFDQYIKPNKQVSDELTVDVPKSTTLSSQIQKVDDSKQVQITKFPLVQQSAPLFSSVFNQFLESQPDTSQPFVHPFSTSSINSDITESKETPSPVKLPESIKLESPINVPNLPSGANQSQKNPTTPLSLPTGFNRLTEEDSTPTEPITENLKSVPELAARISKSGFNSSPVPFSFQTRSLTDVPDKPQVFTATNRNAFDGNLANSNFFSKETNFGNSNPEFSYISNDEARTENPSEVIFPVNPGVFRPYPLLPPASIKQPLVSPHLVNSILF